MYMSNTICHRFDHTVGHPEHYLLHIILNDISTDYQKVLETDKSCIAAREAVMVSRVTLLRF